VPGDLFVAPNKASERR